MATSERAGTLVPDITKEKKMKKLILTSLSVLLVASYSSFAQTSNTSDTSNAANSQPGQVTDQSQSQGSNTMSSNTNVSGTQQQMTPMAVQRAVLINKLHHINQHEIQLGQLAQSQSQSQQVKNFAQQMVQDHQSADQQLQTLAKSENVGLQDFTPADYEKVGMDNLKKLNGSQFDNAFLNMIRTGHKVTMQDLQAVRSDVKDPKIRSYISSILPQIQHHEALASRLERNMPSQMAGQTSGSQS